jgi:hypothetical protein
MAADAESGDMEVHFAGEWAITHAAVSGGHRASAAGGESSEFVE